MTATTARARASATAPAAGWAADFERLEAASPVHAARRAALDRFQALGLPTRRDEAWRYTSLAPLRERTFARRGAGPGGIDRAAVDRHALPAAECHRLVFVNGVYRGDLSSPGTLPPGVRLDSLGAALASDPGRVQRWLGTAASLERDAFTALNTAFIEDGGVLHLPPRTILPQPVHLLFIAAPGPEEPGRAALVTHPRVLIVAGAGSCATILETHAGAGPGRYFTNACTEIIAAEGAEIDHYRVQRETDSCVHVSALWCLQNGPGTLRSSSFVLGGRLVRNNIEASLAAEGCEMTLNGLYLTRGEQHVDQHLRVRHLKPHGRSWEYYKGILDDRSHGVFTGRIEVAEDAQKTDAKQTNMNLLLSDHAGVTSKPQLEIFADDVKCTHGATVGQLDEQQLFYMQARGIPRERARSLLIYAFANETISQVRLEALRDWLATTLLDRLPDGELLPEGS